MATEATKKSLQNEGLEMKKVYVLLCTAIFMFGMGSLPAAAAAEPKSTMFVPTSDNGNAVQAVAALDITAEPDPVRPDEQLYYALTVSKPEQFHFDGSSAGCTLA